MEALRGAIMEEKGIDGAPGDGLTDEDREWIRKVVKMSDEDAMKATVEWRKHAVPKEVRRMDYEHFLGQIP